LKIVHIINPFKGSENHQNIQNITFESIRKAKDYAVDIDVEIYSTQFQEDIDVVPDFINKKIELTKSVIDYNSKLKVRKLPLIKDVLDGVISNCDADYIVYTNIDIGVMPQFYAAINDIIKEGVDAFIINRRRISEKYNSVNQLEQIYSETGEMHNGYDCFVFKRTLYSQFILGNVCLGIPHVGNTLAFNLMCFANKFRLYTHKHLTFHIGYDLVKNWGGKEYLAHNKKEYLKVLKNLNSKIKLINIPGSSFPFIKRHFKWFMNPTLHYPTLLKIDLRLWNTERYHFNETNDKQKGYYEWLQKKIKLD
jgi:hypothetical protein